MSQKRIREIETYRERKTVTQWLTSAASSRSKRMARSTRRRSYQPHTRRRRRGAHCLVGLWMCMCMCAFVGVERLCDRGSIACRVCVAFHHPWSHAMLSHSREGQHPHVGFQAVEAQQLVGAEEEAAGDLIHTVCVVLCVH